MASFRRGLQSDSESEQEEDDDLDYYITDLDVSTTTYGSTTIRFDVQPEVPPVVDELVPVLEATTSQYWNTLSCQILIHLVTYNYENPYVMSKFEIQPGEDVIASGRFYEWVNEWLHRWENGASGSGIAIGSIHSIEVQVFLTEGAGGCLKSTRLQVVGNLGIRSYPCAEGDCLIAIIFNVLKIKNEQGAPARWVREQILNLPPKIPIPSRFIEPLCNYYRIKIKLLDNEEKELGVWGENIEAEITIMLANNHYFHVVNRVLAKTKCHRCRRKYVDGTVHECPAWWCTNCEHWVIKPEAEHECNDKRVEFLEVKEMLKKRKDRLKPVPTFSEKDQNTHPISWADMETFSYKKVHEAYAIMAYDSYMDNWIYYWGPKCCFEFLEYYKKQYTITGVQACIGWFNGSNFDFIALCRAMFKCEDPGLSPKFVMQGSSMLRLECKYFYCLDLIKFIPPMKLKKACKSFNIAEEDSKGDFPHKIVTSWESLDLVLDEPPGEEFYFERPEEIAKLEPGQKWVLKNECLKYLRQDVMATRRLGEIMIKLVQDEFKLPLTKFVTKNQLTWKAFVDSTIAVDDAGKKKKKPRYIPFQEKPQNWLIEIPDEKKHNICVMSTYGGRVYPVKRRFKSRDWKKLKSLQWTPITDKKKLESLGVSEAWQLPEGTWNSVKHYVFAADISGMYGWVMMEKEFPEGQSYQGNPELVATQLEQKQYEDIQLGFLKIKYKANPTLIHPVLPRKIFKESSTVKGMMEAASGLIWDLKDWEGWYPVRDVINAHKNGYKIEVLETLQYPGKVKLFQAHMKRCQDIKDRGGREKNPAKRGFGKDMANSSYGKTLEQPIVKDHAVIRDFEGEKMRAFLAKNWITNRIWIDADSDEVVVEGITKVFKNKIKKPTQLGPTVLAESRDLYEIILNRLEEDRPAAMFVEDDEERRKMIGEHLKKTTFYGDTDSGHIEVDEDDPNNAKVRLGDMIQEAPGKLTNDLAGDGKILNVYYIQPKCYGGWAIVKGDIIIKIKKAKGIPKSEVDVSDYKKLWKGEPLEKKKIRGLRRIGAVDKGTLNKETGLWERTLPFSVVDHYMERSMQSKQWKGRVVFPNKSGHTVPLAHEWAEDLLPDPIEEEYKEDGMDYIDNVELYNEDTMDLY